MDDGTVDPRGVGYRILSECEIATQLTPATGDQQQQTELLIVWSRYLVKSWRKKFNRHKQSLRFSYVSWSIISLFVLLLMLKKSNVIFRVFWLGITFWRYVFLLCGIFCQEWNTKLMTIILVWNELRITIFYVIKGLFEKFVWLNKERFNRDFKLSIRKLNQ